MQRKWCSSGFCYQAGEFCSQLDRQANEVFWGIQITGDL